MSEQALCWIAGKITPATEACIPVLDHGLLYGDGVFEGLRFYQNRVFRLQAHLDRLRDSAKAIALTLPLSISELTAAISDLIETFDGDDGYLRLVVTRGIGPLGLDPRGCSSANCFIIADRLSLVPATVREQGAQVVIASTRLLPPDGLDPRIKSLNYLNHILARLEANQANADEAILLNAHGCVAEGTADNVFIVRDGQLWTPPVSDGALAGITRAEILTLAKQAAIPVKECTLAPYDLYTADEVFLTGTGAELIPVASVDGRTMKYCPGPVYSDLENRFRAFIQQETDQ